MTKSNNADAFKIHVNMMRMSGVWPEASPGIFYQIKTALSWILGTALSITQLMEVVNDVTDVTKLSEILYVMVSVTVYLVKLAGFTYQKKTFVKMLNFLKDPVFVSYPENLDHYMAKTIKMSTLIANMYRYLCLCCMIMFAVYPIVDHKPLPFPLPFDIDTLTTSLMGIAAAQLDILWEKIAWIGENNEKVENEHVRAKHAIKQLKQCTKHHLAIIKFIESIDRVFSVGLLAQFLASIIVICNTLFHFVLISASSSQFFLLANYFCIMIIQLSMYCWYGNEIIVKSVRVGEACYLSKWYNSGNRVGKYLFIIMERSKRPLVITALKFSKLSLTALTSILQWSYSYLTLLLKIYTKNSSAH